MATKIHRFRGKIAWAHHLFNPDDYKGVKRYTVDFYPEDREAIKASGMQLRYDRDTNSFIRPRREVERKFAEETVQFGPPRILDAAGNAFDGRIGNGSYAELTIAVFDTKTFGKGHRLEEVRILDLVEYDRPSGGVAPAATPAASVAPEAPAKPAEVTTPAGVKVKMPF